MTIQRAVSKVEKFFGQKMNYTPYNGQYFLNGLTFYSQDGKVICISTGGTCYDNVTQALKTFNR